MFKKENIKDFLDFKTLITERVLKYVFIAVGGLATLSTIIMIFSRWADAFRSLKYNFSSFLVQLVAAPVIGIIALVITLFALRLGFEGILVRFLLYREVKQINEKTKD